MYERGKLFRYFFVEGLPHKYFNHKGHKVRTKDTMYIFLTDNYLCTLCPLWLNISLPLVNLFT